MPVFYRAAARDDHENIIAVRIFSLPDGVGCVISWPLPQPGLRAFAPTTIEPSALREALPYAQFLREHTLAKRVTIELDDGLQWDPEWGELRDVPRN